MRPWLLIPLIPLWMVACYDQPASDELGGEPLGEEPTDGLDPDLQGTRDDLSREIRELGDTLDDLESREMAPEARQRLDGLREQYDQLVQRAERATQPEQLESVRQQLDEMNAAVLLLGRDIGNGRP